MLLLRDRGDLPVWNIPMSGFLLERGRTWRRKQILYCLTVSRTTIKSVFVHAYIKVINYRIINRRKYTILIKLKRINYESNEDMYVCGLRPGHGFPGLR